MALTNQYIQEKLQEKFGDLVSNFEESYGLLSFEATAANNLKVLQFLYDEPSLQFQFLTDLCGVNFPDDAGREISVVYHLHNLTENVRLRFKIFVPVAAPDVFTACNLFSSANWMERETYDFFGIQFEGHPDLRRILNVDEMTVFPMRREYPLEDPNRVDKKDYFFGR